MTNQQTRQTRIRFLIYVLVSVLLTCGLTACKRQSLPTPVEEPPTTPKDGVITVQFWEVITDSTSGPNPQITEIMVDSLNISEVENRIDIPNAIPFHLPRMNGASIWFFGDFQGMPDTVAVWTDYSRRVGPTKHMYRRISLYLLGKNQGVSVLSAYGAPDTEPVRGFIFALDRDNENSGKGFVTLTVGTHTDTLRIDAAKNTVHYDERAARLDLTFSDSLSQMGIRTPDRESYSVLKDQAIWLLELNRAGQTELFGAPSDDGQTNPFYTKRFTAYGFAPNFIH